MTCIGEGRETSSFVSKETSGVEVGKSKGSILLRGEKKMGEKLPSAQERVELIIYSGKRKKTQTQNGPMCKAGIK